MCYNVHFVFFHYAEECGASEVTSADAASVCMTGPTIALSMGERGLPARLLAPKYGAFLTFGALRAGKESAPGAGSALKTTILLTIACLASTVCCKWCTAEMLMTVDSLPVCCCVASCGTWWHLCAGQPTVNQLITMYRLHQQTAATQARKGSHGHHMLDASLQTHRQEVHIALWHDMTE